MHEPQLLLLDQPYSGFGWERYLCFWEMAERRRAEGMGILIVSHLLAERDRLTRVYLVLFLAMLGIGILQNPMFGDGTPGGLAYVLPDYGAGRVVIDGAFTAGFHAWGELALSIAWLAVLALAVALVLRRLLASAA
jgi:hypothetical protein